MNMLQEILKARSDFRLQGLEPSKLYLTPEARLQLLSMPDVRYGLEYDIVGRNERLFGMLVCKSEHFCWVGI